MAGKRLSESIPPSDLIHLFTDTLMEDPDLYRFLVEGAENIGGELVHLIEGRTPWQVFKDNRFLGNSRVDLCSRILKREIADKYIKTNFPDPSTVTIYLGYDWTEIHRYKRAAARWLPYIVKSPMCDPPFMRKDQMEEELAKQGIKRARLYDLGFAHNNCGGFCIKAGEAHFEHLLNTLPDVFAYHEQQEQKLREYLGKDVAVLRHRSGPKENQPLTLREFRELHTTGQLKIDWTDIGGCGCFSDEPEDSDQ